MFEMHSASRGERKGAQRESAHLSNGGNYSTTPSPVTRGSGGGGGVSKGGWEGLGGMGWVVAATQKAIGPRPLVLSLPTSTMRG